MAKPYEIHVISNTHWDREWLYDFQETRMQLVEFFDTLLDILDRFPEYNSYLMDSQAVPVEDYLEVRPEQRERLARHVAARRLMIGPWYTCPEEFCVNGESLVRNLLYGHRVARSFGHVMKVGHTPFSYGQNSQMPQIYSGFGIDTILFYHGVSHDDTANEFIFEGADGTRILGSQMSAKARYNFYFGLYRPLLYGKPITDRTYAWTEGGLPFHRCSEARCRDHHFLLDPERSFNREHLKEWFDTLFEAEKKTATTRFIAFMQGHDSSVADATTLRIIEEAQEFAGKNKLFHSNLPDLMDQVKKAAKDLEVLKGERRVPKDMGGRIHLYSDVLSSRVKIKRLNARAETALQRWAEPMAAVAWRLGAEYPGELLDLAWKTLLKCHAHDSIAGSGVDEIEEDMIYRLRQVVNIAQGVTRRGLENVQRRIDNSGEDRNVVLLTVFNASPRKRTEVVTAVADLPSTSGYGHDLSLAACKDGKDVPLQIVSRHPHHAVVNHLGDSPSMMTCERVTFRFPAEKIPGLGYTTYRLQRKAIPERGLIASGHNLMENEHLIVRIQPDGTLSLTHKATGRVFDRLHYFEDSGEAGVAWMHVEPSFDRVVSSLGGPVTISLEENGPLLARYRIAYHMAIPVALDDNGSNTWERLDGRPNAARRRAETRELEIVSEVTLSRGARAVHVVTRFDNRCNDHRLRVMFPTGLKTKSCHAENAFDVVEREVEYGPGSAWEHGINPTFPMQRFVDVNDGKAGLAVLNEGLREYQVTPEPDRAIAVTLLRAYEIALATVSWSWDCHPEMPLSQSPGMHECRYAIYPHAGDWTAADVFGEADRFLVPLEPAQTGAHEGDLPQRHGFLDVQPDNLVVTALKRAEDDQGLVLRLFNPTDKAIEGAVTVDLDVHAARFVTLEEEPLETCPMRGKTARLKVGPKKIVTLKFT